MKGVNAGEKNPMFGKTPHNTKRISVYSEKHIGDKNFVVRSSYEARYVKELNENINVISFLYEPDQYKCTYYTDKKRTYQPDFLVNELSLKYVAEIKAKWQETANDTLVKKEAFLQTFELNYKLIVY